MWSTVPEDGPVVAKNKCCSEPLTEITSSGAPLTIWYSFKMNPEGTDPSLLEDGTASLKGESCKIDEFDIGIVL
jgi:hypothetical protein